MLRQAERVQEFATPSLYGLIADLQDTMHAAHGAGLAAPQIGINLQVVIFGGNEPNPRYPGRALVPPTVLVNPEITALSDVVDTDWEGCLSIPGLKGLVPRWRSIRYQGFDAQGVRIDRTVHDFHARVVQHECDHLWGRLYPTRMTDLTQLGFVDAM